MEISCALKANTVFSLLSLGFELESPAMKIASLIQDKTYNYDNRDVETEIYTCSIDARNGLNEDYENYFLQVLNAYRDLPKFL